MPLPTVSANITITISGPNTGPFDLYSNVDGYTTPFENNIPKPSLTTGYTVTTVPMGTTTIEIRSDNFTCTNSAYINLSGTPSCLCATVTINNDDLLAATGNTNSSLNGVLFLNDGLGGTNGVKCNGDSPNKQYEFSGIDYFCTTYSGFPLINLYYYQNNNVISGATVLSDVLTGDLCNSDGDCACCDYGYTLEDGICILSANTLSGVSGTTYIFITGDTNLSYLRDGTFFYENITTKTLPLTFANNASFITNGVLSGSSLPNGQFGGLVDGTNYTNSQISNLYGTNDSNISGVPITVVMSATTAPWRETSLVSPWNGIMNKGGIKFATGFNQWVGFYKCLNVPSTQTYHLFLSADDMFGLKLDGEWLIKRLNKNSAAYPAFTVGNAIGADGLFDKTVSPARFLPFHVGHVLPITLDAGTHIFEFFFSDAFNYGAGCCTNGCFEIYSGVSVNTLTGVTTYNGLSGYTAFSTRQITGLTQTILGNYGDNYGIFCDIGGTLLGICDTPYCYFEEPIGCDDCTSCDNQYTWTPIGGGICVATDVVSSTPPVTPYTAYTRTFAGYSNLGTIIYDDDWGINGSGTTITALTTPNLWINTTTTNGPLNRTAVWAYDASFDPIDYPLDVYLGFTKCLENITGGTYYIGIAADNEFRLEIDGNVFIDTYNYTGITELDKFNKWHVYPIDLLAGDHVIGVYGYNFSITGTPNPAGFGCEIYNNTLSELTGATTTGDLNIIFSTTEFVNEIIPVIKDGSGNYLSSGYTCPSGYEYAPCDGNCWKILYCGNLVPTPTPTVTPTPTPSPTPTSTPTPTPTNTPTPTPTPTNTPTPTPTPTNTPTPTPTSTPSGGNFIVQNNSGDGFINSVYGVGGLSFAISDPSYPVGPGTTESGTQGGYGNYIYVDVTAPSGGGSLKLRKNGVEVDCISVPCTPPACVLNTPPHTNFSGSDTLTIQLNDTSC